MTVLACMLAGISVADSRRTETLQVGSESFRRTFQARAGATALIGISSSDDCSATISLIAPDGRRIARETNFLRKVLPYTGRYTVRINGCTSGFYVDIDPVPPPDAYESDDTAEAARPLIPNGEPQAHTLQVPLDQDWVKFEVPADHLLTLETYRLRTGCDTILTLYDPDLVQIAESDNYQFTERSRIQLVLSRGGQYYARVRHRGNQGGKGKGYYLRATAAVPVYAGKIKAPRRIAFPTLPVNAARTHATYVANLSQTELLNVATAAVEGPFATDLPAGEMRLLPGKRYRFTVQFQPTMHGPATGRITLSTSDPANPTVVIDLAGRGR